MSILVSKNKKKQINEFIDKDHLVMDEFYTILDKKMSLNKRLNAMLELIKKDQHFYDPYLIAADILFDQGNDKEASIMLKEGYERAISTISSSKGKWPKEMRWGFLENRHLMRMLDRYAVLCWEDGNIDEALNIFRSLLRVNPADNQGVRYSILAIKLNFSFEEWQASFISKDGDLCSDALKVIQWFEENATKFSEEFEWFFKFHKDNDLT